MAEPQTRTKAEETSLNELGFALADEIEAPEEEASEAVDPEAETEISELAAEPEAVEAVDGEEGEEEEEVPAGNLDAFNRILAEQAAKIEEGSPKAAEVDPTARLAQTLESSHEKLLKRMEELSAQRSAGEPETKEGQEERDEVEAALEAATRVLESRGYDPEQASDMMAVQAELLKVFEEKIRSKEIAPLQERLNSADQATEKQRATVQRNQEFARGLANLARAGETEQQLVKDFVTAFQADPSKALQGTYLGRAFLQDWDGAPNTVPPYMRSAHSMEMAGRIAADYIDRTVTAARNGEAPPASSETDGLEAVGGPSRRRPARPKTNPSDASTEEREMAERLADEGNSFAAAFPEFYK